MCMLICCVLKDPVSSKELLGMMYLGGDACPAWVEGFIMEGFSRTLPHPAWMPPVIFSVTFPVLSDDIAWCRVNSWECGEF